MAVALRLHDPPTSAPCPAIAAWSRRRVLPLPVVTQRPSKPALRAHPPSAACAATARSTAAGSRGSARWKPGGQWPPHDHLRLTAGAAWQHDPAQARAGPDHRRVVRARCFAVAGRNAAASRSRPMLRAHPPSAAYAAAARSTAEGSRGSARWKRGGQWPPHDHLRLTAVAARQHDPAQARAGPDHRRVVRARCFAVAGRNAAVSGSRPMLRAHPPSAAYAAEARSTAAGSPPGSAGWKRGCRRSARSPGR
jgi:hypothetical protein